MVGLLIVIFFSYR